MIPVPYKGIGDQVSMATIRGDLLSGLASRVADMPSGEGIGYLGTIEGIHIYNAIVLTDRAILCSGLLLQQIDYGVVHGTEDIVDFNFIESDDPRKSGVRLKFAQRVNWSDDVFIEIRLNPILASSES